MQHAISSSRKIISLVESIPQSHQDQALHRAGMLFENLRQPWPGEAMYLSLEILDLLPDLSTEQRFVLSQVPHWQHEPPDAVHIYKFC